SIGTMWVVTGVVSVVGFPHAESYLLLRRAGVPEPLLPIALYGASLLDILLGLACLMKWRPKWIWPAQMMLIVLYTTIITLKLPEFWLHPYGPILKNLPILAAIWVVFINESSQPG